MKNRKNFNFGIVGCGNMGMALARSLREFAGIPEDKICVTDVDKSKAEIFKKKFGIFTLNTSILVTNSRFIIIAVKPKDVSEVCSNISPYLKKNSIIISVAAGITIDSIKKMLNRDVSVIRFMPNLAIGYGKGLIAYCSKDVTATKLKEVVRIFSRVGYCFPVKEKDMFLMTAVVGSTPGFFFYLAELIYELLRKRG
ncbi:MAG: NAD(P)-binding domain-containing protein, partial [Candidatus Omnitrophica bacterium]|nr:NAD(P)-binding domain-containing protein [Candidatus Omnitrophota bacterium]